MLGALVGAVSLILITFSSFRKRRQVQGQMRRYSESGEEERMSTHDLLLHIPSEEFDAELAAAIVAAGSAVRSNPRGNPNIPAILI